MEKRLKIALLAPSGPVDWALMEQGIQLFKQDLEALCPGVAAEIIEEYLTAWPAEPRVPYLQADDRVQAEAFAAAMGLPGLDLIWTARGGYGASRWICLVPWGSLEADGPSLLGFSDVTFIHAGVQRQLGRPGIHGPMIQTYVQEPEEVRADLIRAIVFGEYPVLKGDGLLPGAAEGILIGGNLSCICHTLGTPMEPAWEGAILALEDVNEAPYRVDRMLTHLKNAGVLDRIAGMVFGRFVVEGDDKAAAAKEEAALQAVLKERISGLAVPAGCAFPFGHGSSGNYPIYIGARYRLSVSGNEAELQPAFPAKAFS